ncbi:MAG: hypothetical protein AAB576_10720 [Elusimicrobiota bacterium]
MTRRASLVLALLLSLQSPFTAHGAPAPRRDGLPRASDDDSMEKAQEEMFALKAELAPLLESLDGLRTVGLRGRSYSNYAADRAGLLRRIAPKLQRFLVLRNEFTKVRLEQTWVSVVSAIGDASKNKPPSAQAAAGIMVSQSRRTFTEEARAFEDRALRALQAEEAANRKFQAEEAARVHKRRILIAIAAGAALLALIAYLSL